MIIQKYKKVPQTKKRIFRILFQNNKYIMQTCFCTTIYVQILLFFVTQILTPHSFFSMWSILVIFMDKAAQTQYFWAIKKFFEKRVKRGTYRNFCKICQKLKKSQFFVKFQYSVPFLPFWWKMSQETYFLCPLYF